MKMKRNIKIFLASGIPFSIFIGILNSYIYGIPAGVISGLIAGAVFGFLMFFILGFLHGRAVKKIGDGKFGDETGVDHTRSIELNLPYDCVFDLCIRSLGLITNCKVLEEDRANGIIIAKAGINWKTWSDKVSFYINGIGNNRTNVNVSSRPTARTTIVDFGKNLDNVESIVSFINTSAGAGRYAYPDANQSN